MNSAQTLAAGFNDPVSDSARAFRVILDVMSRPGRVTQLPSLPDAPGTLPGAAAAVALTLLDTDTPVWLDPSLRSETVLAFLAFHTGAPVVSEPEAASFAFMPALDCEDALRALRVGSSEYPDRSGTAVILVDGFDAGLSAALSGPGIDGSSVLCPTGLTATGWRALQDNAQLFPLGFDTIFVSQDAAAALPRSSRIELKG